MRNPNGSFARTSSAARNPHWKSVSVGRCKPEPTPELCEKFLMPMPFGG